MICCYLNLAPESATTTTATTTIELRLNSGRQGEAVAKLLLLLSLLLLPAWSAWFAWLPLLRLADAATWRNLFAVAFFSCFIYLFYVFFFFCLSRALLCTPLLCLCVGVWVRVCACVQKLELVAKERQKERQKLKGNMYAVVRRSRCRAQSL